MSVYRRTPRDTITNQSNNVHENDQDLAWNDDEEGRLPVHVAFAWIILLSLSCWVLTLGAVLWLIRVAN